MGRGEKGQSPIKRECGPCYVSVLSKQKGRALRFSQDGSLPFLSAETDKSSPGLSGPAHNPEDPQGVLDQVHVLGIPRGLHSQERRGGMGRAVQTSVAGAPAGQNKGAVLTPSHLSKQPGPFSGA